MRGLQLHSPYYEEDVPVDFALSSEGVSVVLWAHWWTISWALGEGLEVAYDEFEPIPPLVGEEPYSWAMGDAKDIVLAGAADADMAARIVSARENTDLHRSEYLTALANLQESLGDGIDISPWIEAVNARPEIDVVKELQERNSGLRKVGRIFLNSVQGSKAVLAIDEYGNAAVGGSSEWLQVFAEQWSSNEDRPDMEDFFAWLIEQRLPIPASLEAGKIEMTTGYVDDIVNRQR
jgi:hypothetical protein